MGTRSRLGRPPAGDSAETRRRILHAARQRFARDGYRATTNRSIADDVGISSSALYHYFESKAELYSAVYCDTIDEVYTAFEAAARSRGHVLDQYAAVLDKACELQAVDPSITGFLVAVAQETQRHPDLLERLAPQRGRHTRLFADLVAGGVARGEVAADVDPDAVADLLGAVLTGLARMAAAAGDPQRYVGAVAVLQRYFDGTLLTRAGSTLMPVER
jgi:TetR/AcrR family transcriptional regulator, repressor for uid operon